MNDEDCETSLHPKRAFLCAGNTAAGKGKYGGSIRIRWEMFYEMLYEIQSALNHGIKECSDSIDFYLARNRS